MLWWLAQNALGATVLAGAVALLTRFVRFRPAVAHILWLLVILKLLAPPVLVLPWPSAQPAPAVPIAETSSNTPRLVLRNTSTAPAEAPPSGMTASAVPDKSPYERWLAWARTAATRESLQSLLTRTWLIGALAMAMLQLAWLVRLRLGLRKGLAPPSWLLDELLALAEHLGVKPPRAVVLSTGSPLLAGGLRPTLVLPASLFDHLDTHGWRSVIAHELIHLKRRDHWIGWLELAAACLWWWNPVFWYARRRLRESAEYACDAWVVRLLPENRRAYAESLITVVASLTRHPLPVASIGMAAHGKRIFERRLEMILREAVPHRMSRLAITGAALAALLMLPGWASPTTSPPPRQLAKAPNVAKIILPTTSASDQTREPKQESNMEMTKLPDSAAPAVSPSPPRPVKSRSARTAGKPAAASPNRPMQPKQESAKATPELPDPIRPTASTPSPRQLAELQNVTVGSGLQIRSNYTDPSKTIDLEKECSIQFENQHLSSIVDYLTEFYGYNFVMDPRVIAPNPNRGRPDFPTPPGLPTPPEGMQPAQAAPDREYVTDGMVSFINLEKVPLGKTIEVLLNMMNLGYRVVGSVIFISTPENLGKADLKPPVLGPDQEGVAKRLNAEIAIEFEEQPLTKILDYLHQYAQVDFEIDPEAKLPGTDRAAKEAVVSYIRLEKVPLWEALYWLTSTLDLTYTVKGETVWVTTPDRVSEVGK